MKSKKMALTFVAKAANMVAEKNAKWWPSCTSFFYQPKHPNVKHKEEKSN